MLALRLQLEVVFCTIPRPEIGVPRVVGAFAPSFDL